MSGAQRHPEVVWAQRSDLVFLTIELADAQDVKVEYTPEGKLSFSATAGNQPYTLDWELYDKLNVAESKTKEGPRHTILLLKKEETTWWPKLLKGPGRAPPNVKVDWDKWVDEDEEAGAGLDPDFMRQFQAPGAFGEDDDDELPELEK